MDQKDMRALAREFAPIVREFVGEAIAPLVRRLEALEGRQPVAGKDGVGIAGAIKDAGGLLVLTLTNGQTVQTGIRDGAKGIDADLDAVARTIRETVAAAVADLPPPVNGRDIDPETVKAIVAGEVEAAVGALPRAEGIEASDVAVAIAPLQAEIAVLRDAVAAIPELPELPDIPALVEASAAAVRTEPMDWTEVEAIVARAVPVAVEAAVASLPKPKDGRDVTVAELMPAVEECVAKAIAAAPKPKDGVGLAGAVIDRAGVLTLTLTDGSTRELGVVTVDAAAVMTALRAELAAWPRPKDGVDGVGFDDMEILQDAERTFVWRFVRGERTKEFRFDVPVVIDRGVWREGGYKRGDGVTLGGCFFIAQRDTTAKPIDGTGADDWRMAARKGRDGKSVTLNDVKPMIDKAVALAVAAMKVKT